MITNGSYSLHSVSFVPFESVFGQGFLQIAKKGTLRIARRKETGKISDKSSSKVKKPVFSLTESALVVKMSEIIVLLAGVCWEPTQSETLV